MIYITRNNKKRNNSNNNKFTHVIKISLFISRYVAIDSL